MNWSKPHTVKSNARRAAKGAGVDPDKVAAFVKAGKTLFRFPMPAKPTPDFQDSLKTGGKAKWKSAAQKKREAKAAKAAAKKDTNGLRRMGAAEHFIADGQARAAKAKPAKSPGKSTESQVKALAATKATGGKFETVAALLRRPGGASMPEVVAITGWKPHSARARISVDVSRLLIKGEEIQRTRADGVSVYAIVKSKQPDLPIGEAA